MQHLHNSAIKVHGNLKSSNIVIDNRWTCKVTDHDLVAFKAGQAQDEEAGVDAKYYGRLRSVISKILQIYVYIFKLICTYILIYLNLYSYK